MQAKWGANPAGGQALQFGPNSRAAPNLNFALYPILRSAQNGCCWCQRMKEARDAALPKQNNNKNNNSNENQNQNEKENENENDDKNDDDNTTETTTDTTTTTTTRPDQTKAEWLRQKDLKTAQF